MRALTLGPREADSVVLFAAGAGGDPQRHLPLLNELAAHGRRVVAPHFDRLTPADVDPADLVARPAGLVEALAHEASPDADVSIVGHSIGAWAALCLAGAVPWAADGESLDVPRESRVARLVLYAPAAGWFGAPGALAAVTTPMLVYVGELDTVTPIEQSAHLRSAPAEVELRIVPNAGHFSFMHEPPPGVTEDPRLDRESFLAEMVSSTTKFVCRHDPPAD